jgi:SAM-dependent methyltransferase
VRDYYEDLWERLPDRLSPPDLELRRGFLTAGVRPGDRALDLGWASEVIEHIADTASWLSEVRRVLAPTGRLLVTTPDHGRIRLLIGGIERHSEPLGDHLHLYTRRSLRELLAGFGFGEVNVRPVGGVPLMRRLLLGRAVRVP